MTKRMKIAAITNRIIDFSGSIGCFLRIGVLLLDGARGGPLQLQPRGGFRTWRGVSESASATRGNPFENLIRLSSATEERRKEERRLSSQPLPHKPSRVQAPTSRSVTARSLWLGFSIAYSTRSQSSNVRSLC